MKKLSHPKSLKAHALEEVAREKAEQKALRIREVVALESIARSLRKMAGDEMPSDEIAKFMGA